MSRLQIAAGNWKMNKSFDEGLLLTQSLCGTEIPEDVQVILGAPYIHLKTLVDFCKDVPRIDIAAQNCHHKESGAYTGEISAHMLQSIGLKYVILGHSERRQYYGETDELIREKIKIAFAHGLTPIYCCGEPLQDRKMGRHEMLVGSQVSSALFGLDEAVIDQLIIAYEPVWAIGTGETASPQQAQDMHAFIRANMADQFGETLSSKIPILYGGSVKPANANEIFGQEDVDGGLVGGASLKADDFTEIINAF